MNYTYEDYKAQINRVFKKHEKNNAVVCLNSDNSQTNLRYSEKLNIESGKKYSSIDDGFDIFPRSKSYLTYST